MSIPAMHWMGAAGFGALMLGGGGSQLHAAESHWKELSSDEKPWTRWWWLGSGVDEANLTRELEAFAAAGLGGVEICPIYGAKGYEERDREFLSKEWMKALAHTIREAKRLGLGVDLTTGTGWPFGGPWVEGDMASQGLERIKEDVAGGARFKTRLKGRVVALRAVSMDGRTIDLSEKVSDGGIDWLAPEGSDWKVYGLTSPSSIQMVKRAAPGGAGPVLDPYSKDAIKAYLEKFDEAFEGFDAPFPRSHFHDSFEYYGAEWSTNLLSAFREQHGYDLLDHLPEFLGDGEDSKRIQADWRSTLSEMHREYLSEWHDWANGMGSMTRNQAHGSPGNLLDHYAVADIPETEIFRKVEENQIPTMNLAASAAHVNGRKLVSAESFTWLGEHFQVKPAELKEAADFLFLSGVNHLFFHGIPYSPADAGWPGWLFYASTHMGPNGGLWREMPAFTGYLGRVQSVLQGGRPDSEVMMYFPFDDLLADGGDRLPLFTIHNQNEWMHGSAFHRAAMKMWENGIPYEAVSERMLEGIRVEDGRAVLGDVKAKVLVVPDAKLLPLAALERMRELSKLGVELVFIGDLPRDVPGYGDLEARRQKLENLKGEIPATGVVQELLPALKSRGVLPEPMTVHGLRLIRRSRDDGFDYFVVNRSGKSIDEKFALGRSFESVVLLDPSSEKRSGLAASDPTGTIRLVLAAGESVVIRTYSKTVNAPGYDYRIPLDECRELVGPWQVEFIEGGPVLPKAFEAKLLGSWTEGSDPALRSFSGSARYTHEFSLDEKPEGGVLIDLGEVGTTCRLSLNGKSAGSSFFPPHRFEVGGLLNPGSNLLEVEVTNLAANRIADLDRRGIQWKSFHEINFVNIDYKLFDASGWEPQSSGLIGPVKMVPLR